MASGSPSSRCTSLATSLAFASVTRKSGRTDIARSANNRMASTSISVLTSADSRPASSSGGTGISCSPLTRSGARDVTRILVRCEARSI